MINIKNVKLSEAKPKSMFQSAIIIPIIWMLCTVFNVPHTETAIYVLFWITIGLSTIYMLADLSGNVIKDRYIIDVKSVKYGYLTANRYGDTISILVSSVSVLVLYQYYDIYMMLLFVCASAYGKIVITIPRKYIMVKIIKEMVNEEKEKDQ